MSTVQGASPRQIVVVGNGMAGARFAEETARLDPTGERVHVSVVGTEHHPAYTRVLLSAIPVPDPTAHRDRELLEGDVPSPANPPSGCPFHPRCPYAFDRCPREVPALLPADGFHASACHLPLEEKERLGRETALSEL